MADIIIKESLKNKFLVLSLAVLVLSSTSACMKGYSDNINMSETETQSSKELSGEISKSFYEITPSDPEWKDMDLSEAYDKTSLKKLDYETMTTEDVLAVCFEYPFLTEINCYNSFSQAINAFKSHAIQFQILYDREDAPKVLMDEFRKFELTTTDHTKAFKEFYGKELFMFAMLRCLYEDNRLSDEDFKEAEELHFGKHHNEYAALNGEETTPYDPEFPRIYW